MRLSELIECYIGYRQGLGARFKTNASLLRAFSRTVGVDATITAVGKDQVEAFLNGSGPVTSAWHIKHNALLGFYRYAVSRGYVEVSPVPVITPKHPPRFIPYIYTRDEVRRLLEAAEAFKSRCTRFEPVSARIMVLMLYATGLRVHEVIRLNRADIDLSESLLTVHDSKFFKSRLVPFGAQLRRELEQYAENRRVVIGDADGMTPFFSMRSGARVRRSALEQRFQTVRHLAGVRRTDGARYQPRLHDLRHTFAVHRLTSWYQQGADVQMLLPKLSVYLGHAYLCSTQVYLTMTPELLREAGARFGRYAQEGESHD